MRKICPECGEEFDARGLPTHQRLKHGKAKSESTGFSIPPEILELAREEIANTVKTEVEKAVPVIQSTIEGRISQDLSSAIDAITTRVDEAISTSADQIASRTQAELERRLEGIGGGEAKGLQNPMAQALVAKLLGGGDTDFLSQASKIGTALGAMMMPVAQIQAQSFSNALRLIDIAQKFPLMPETEKQKTIQELGQVTPLASPEVK